MKTKHYFKLRNKIEENKTNDIPNSLPAIDKLMNKINLQMADLKLYSQQLEVQKQLLTDSKTNMK